MIFRTDRNNNPCAFTTDIAKEGGLTLGADYEVGESFTAGLNVYYTAKLIGDPIALTIKVIDTIGFYTHSGNIRWIYIGIPKFLWDSLDKPTKIKVIAFMYGREGGVEMKGLFV